MTSLRSQEDLPFFGKPVSIDSKEFLKICFVLNGDSFANLDQFESMPLRKFVMLVECLREIQEDRTPNNRC